MKIQFASDLHLEFPENQKFIEEHPLQPVGDILILAGDVIPLVFYSQHQDFFKRLSDSFEQVHWLPGNHEFYYGGDVGKFDDAFCEKVLPNVQLVNNVTVENDDLKFIFTTLWSEISELHQWEVYCGLSDFQQIRFKDEPLTVEHFNILHAISADYVEREIQATPEDKTLIVATHHVPTKINYPSKKFDGSALNEAFMTNLLRFVLGGKPDYWIYGHHHSFVEDFTYNKTTFLTNQLGYVDSQRLYEKFDLARCIEV